MTDDVANLLGAVGLAVADRIHQVALDVMQRAGETPAALIVIGYGQGPSNETLRRVLGLSHPGSVRLIDRLVADGLVERRRGRDRRAVALYLTKKGYEARESLLAGRLAAIRSLIEPLGMSEREGLRQALYRILEALPENDADRCRLCRMCDDRVCKDCPIPATFKSERSAA